MPRSILRPLLFSVALGLIAFSYPSVSNATSTAQAQSQSSAIEYHFVPKPSKATHIDFDAWNFILSETVLYMGPSTRTSSPDFKPILGTRARSSHSSRHKLEGNKVMYSLMTDEVKSETKAYADELIEIGNRLDIPALSNDEQLAYWINLHNAVLITTVSAHYPPPFRRPTLIEPIKGSEVKLHDAKLIKIDGFDLSLRDIREKIVFPNWKNKDVPFAFHLGYLGSPNMPNYAYSAPNIKNQLKINADEFVNSRRGYHRGQLNPYVRDVAPWYYPNLEQDLDRYFKQRMRPDVYAKYASRGIDRVVREDLTLADMTGGFGLRSSISPLQRTGGDSDLGFQFDFGFQSSLGTNINQFLEQRSSKLRKLNKLKWYTDTLVTIEDTPTEDTQSIKEP